jgi:WD40 repeat protein
VAFSPDLTRLLSGSKNPGVVSDRTALALWRIEDGEALGSLSAHTDQVDVVALAPGGRYAASQGRGEPDGLHVWNLATGALVRVLEPVDAAVFVSERELAVSGRQGGLRIWDVTSGAQKHELPMPRLTSLARLGDGRLLGAGDSGVVVRDLGPGAAELVLRTDGAGPVLVAASADATRALTIAGPQVQLWDLRTGRVLRSLSPQRAAISAGVITSTGQVLLGVGGSAQRRWPFRGRGGGARCQPVEPLGWRDVARAWAWWKERALRLPGDGAGLQVAAGRGDDRGRRQRAGSSQPRLAALESGGVVPGWPATGSRGPGKTDAGFDGE